LWLIFVVFVVVDEHIHTKQQRNDDVEESSLAMKRIEKMRSREEGD